MKVQRPAYHCNPKYIFSAFSLLSPILENSNWWLHSLLILHLCLILRLPSTSNFNSPFEQISLIHSHTYTHTHARTRTHTHTSPIHHQTHFKAPCWRTHAHTHVHSHRHISLISCSYLPVTHPKWFREWGAFLFPQWRANKKQPLSNKHTKRHTPQHVKQLSIFNDTQTSWPSIAGPCVWFVCLWQSEDTQVLVCGRKVCLFVHPKYARFPKSHTTNDSPPVGSHTGKLYQKRTSSPKRAGGLSQ